MTHTETELDELMKEREDEHLEFKEAKNNFDARDLLRYCAALANEQGGKLVLGVTDKRPRQIVGTRAFENPQKAKAYVIEVLRIRVEVDEIYRPEGRVLIFTVPSRPIGVPVQYDGSYWMRRDGSIVTMTRDYDQGHP